MKLFHTLFVSTLLLFSSAVFAVNLDKININTANAEQISSAMSGVGESKAKAIVKYRNSHGKFKSSQDLVNVKGIGGKTVAINKDRIML